MRCKSGKIIASIWETFQPTNLCFFVNCQWPQAGRNTHNFQSTLRLNATYEATWTILIRYFNTVLSEPRWGFNVDSCFQRDKQFKTKCNLKLNGCNKITDYRWSDISTICIEFSFQLEVILILDQYFLGLNTFITFFYTTLWVTAQEGRHEGERNGNENTQNKEALRTTLQMFSPNLVFQPSFKCFPAQKHNDMSTYQQHS